MLNPVTLCTNDASGNAVAVSAANPLPMAGTAGTATLGKVGIDQTTPGTTDSVTVATGQGAGAAIGATSGAAVITDASGTIQQYLRGLIKQWIAGTLVVGPGTNAIGSVNTQGTKTTYSAEVNIVQTAIGVVLQIQGSGTKTITVTRIGFSGALTTAANGKIIAYKSSAAASGGSPVTAAATDGGVAKYDSNNAAPTATVTFWSTPPSGVGTQAGGIRRRLAFAGAGTTAGTQSDLDFGTRSEQGAVLRGTGEYLMLYVTFGSLTGANFDIDVSWTEE